MNLRQWGIGFSLCAASILVLHMTPSLAPVPALAQSAQGGALRLEKTRFAPGEEMRVSFQASADYAGNAWVGIIPSNVAHGNEAVNDQNDLTYQYLEKRTSGVLVFKAPGQAGAYDFRMHDRDDNGVEVASVTFHVVVGGAGAESALHLEKTTFAPGEEIRVSFRAAPDFTADAWVGIVPSGVAHGSEATNDQNDVDYQHLNNRTAGELVFKAPAQPGSYDFRMHDRDDNGKEVASVSFRVSGGSQAAPEPPMTTPKPQTAAAGAVGLRLEKNRFAPGEEIRISFWAPPGFQASAWVGIVPSGVAHGSEATNDQNDVTYQHLNNRTAGELVFKAPAQPGSYDFRMNDRDDNGTEVASVSFRVE